MKIKIFLLMIILILSVSCSKNNPSNPLNNNSGGNTANPSDTNIDSYSGTVQYTVSTQGVTTHPEEITIYVDINNHDHFVEVYIPKMILFENAVNENGKYNLNKTENGISYILSMTVNGETISDFNMTIQGNDETYYLKSAELTKINDK